MSKLTKSAQIAFDEALETATVNFATCGPFNAFEKDMTDYIASLEAAIPKLLARSSRNTEAARTAGRYTAELNRAKENI